MKGNIKKLTVFVMIASMAMFTAAAMASANEHEWNAIHGEYAMVGVGGCLVSNLPFANNYTVPSTAVSYGSQDTYTGIWTFKRDGKGTVQMTHLKLFPPPRPSSSPLSMATTADLDFDFNYTVKDDGTITGAMVPGTYKATYVTGPPAGATLILDQLHFSGTVSKDHKTITLASGNEPAKVDAYKADGTYSSTSYIICNTVRILTRLDEIEKKEKED